jgi:pimeloyl-ACP methyl ester carboxylesterase
MPIPVLLVPAATELEWRIKPALAEKTEVASFDAPGIGDEPPPARFGRRAIAERGVQAIEAHSWDQCVVVGDEFGSLTAAMVASLAPDRVAGLALGHACLSYETQGPHPAINGEVLEGFMAMERTNYRAYARALSQITQGSYDEDFADAYIERVPQQTVLGYSDLYRDGTRLVDLLEGWNGHLLLAEHYPCLLWTREGFHDASAAFPDARRIICESKPSVSPQFAEAVIELCGAG